MLEAFVSPKMARRRAGEGVRRLEVVIVGLLIRN